MFVTGLEKGLGKKKQRQLQLPQAKRSFTAFLKPEIDCEC